MSSSCSPCKFKLVNYPISPLLTLLPPKLIHGLTANLLQASSSSSAACTHKYVCKSTNYIYKTHYTHSASTPMPTQLIIQKSLCIHTNTPLHSKPVNILSDMQEERHYLPSSAWSRNRMSSPAHAHRDTHTQTHTFTHSLTGRGRERKGEQESQREREIRRKARVRRMHKRVKEQQENATAKETIRRRRKEKRRRRVYSCTYGAVLNRTRMTEVCASV